MNPKKINPAPSLKYLVMLLILFSVAVPVLAQPFSNTRFVHKLDGSYLSFFCYLNKTTRDATGPIKDSNSNPSPNSPSLFGFMEFNNGSFAYTDAQFITNTGDYSLFSIRQPLFHINPNHLGGAAAILKLSGIYGRPPRREPVSTGVMRTDDELISNRPNDFTPQPLISAATGLKISSNIWDIAPDDPMIFVLTYKIPDTSRMNSLSFTYNRDENGNPKEIFIPVKPGAEELIKRLDSEDQNSIRAIRCYGREIAVADEANAAIYFNKLVKDGREHHIFISLLPLDDLEAKQSTQLQLSAFEADFTGPALLEKPAAAQTQTLLSTASSHDPNSIDVWPGCFDSSAAPLSLSYSVRFQNLGRNKANKIKVEVMLGDHIDMRTIRNISVYCRGLPVGKTPRPRQVNFPGPIYSYVITGQSIIFTINRARLQQVLSMEDMNRISTMGEIRFRVTTLPLQRTDHIESTASITFDTNEPVKVEDPARVDFSSPCRPNRLRRPEFRRF